MLHAQANLQLHRNEILLKEAVYKSQLEQLIQIIIC